MASEESAPALQDAPFLAFGVDLDKVERTPIPEAVFLVERGDGD
jgi:hypothetical protein